MRHDNPSDEIVSRIRLRGTAALGLGGIALIHFLDLFSKFRETPYLGVIYVALITGSLAAAAALKLPGDRPARAAVS